MEVNAREEHPYNDPSAWFVRYLDHQGDWLEKTRGNLVVAATVIAAMSFGVMVNPPGGVWQSEDCSPKGQTVQTRTCEGKVGTSILEHHPTKRFFYLGMVISNLVSFSASMGIILLVITGFRFRNRLIMTIMVMFMVVAVLCISAAFFFAVALVQHEDDFIQNNPDPISAVFMVGYKVNMLWFGTSTTVYSTVAAFGSATCPLKKRMTHGSNRRVKWKY